MHLTSNGCVAIRFKMLTYCVYAPLLNLIDALPLNVIYNFETASKPIGVILLETCLFLFVMPDLIRHPER
jgi:hypothetical protein